MAKAKFVLSEPQEALVTDALSEVKAFRLDVEERHLNAGEDSILDSLYDRLSDALQYVEETMENALSTGDGKALLEEMEIASEYTVEPGDWDIGLRNFIWSALVDF